MLPRRRGGTAWAPGPSRSGWSSSHATCTRIWTADGGISPRRRAGAWWAPTPQKAGIHPGCALSWG
eukprot:6303014-Pyramimonas_sp.AAC.1